MITPQSSVAVSIRQSGQQENMNLPPCRISQVMLQGNPSAAVFGLAVVLLVVGGGVLLQALQGRPLIPSRGALVFNLACAGTAEEETATSEPLGWGANRVA
jgi:hypothetical protein